MATLGVELTEALEALPPQATATEKAEVIEAVIGRPDARTRGFLWKTLVLGLTIALLLALGGLLWAVMDGNEATGTDVIVTAFTAVLTGLLGLFVKSPTQSAS